MLSNEKKNFKAQSPRAAAHFFKKILPSTSYLSVSSYKLMQGHTQIRKC